MCAASISDEATDKIVSIGTMDIPNDNLSMKSCMSQQLGNKVERLGKANKLTTYMHSDTFYAIWTHQHTRMQCMYYIYLMSWPGLSVEQNGHIYHHSHRNTILGRVRRGTTAEHIVRFSTSPTLPPWTVSLISSTTKPVLQFNLVLELIQMPKSSSEFRVDKDNERLTHDCITLVHRCRGNEAQLLN